jgi:hypothetical protein
MDFDSSSNVNKATFAWEALSAMSSKIKEKIFRDLHEAFTEWTCQYCQEVATTVRQGAAVCSQHSHLWALGAETVQLEASRSH